MYDIALSVAACVRSGTRADVAWMVSGDSGDDALAFTPGGGRIGSLGNGAFDGLLADVAARRLPTGRLVNHIVTEIESLQAGLPAGSQVTFALVPADQFPVELWPRLLRREPVVLRASRLGDEITQVTMDGLDEQADQRGGLVERGQCTTLVEDAELFTVLVPVTRLVIAGGGPMAEALAGQGRLLGWKVTVESRPDLVAGLVAGLSWMDAVVVLGHDVETSSRSLMAALDSDAGYLGSVGSASMQQSRADWLAYRDITDLTRVHGPAGLDLGARSPAEVAVSIVAQILGERHRLMLLET